MRKEKQSWVMLSRLLFVVKAVIFCAVIYVGVAGIKTIDLARAFPFSTVKIYGIHEINKEEVKSVVLPFTRSGFFAINIEELHDKLLQNPWASRVVVQRKWPDELSITFVERTPIANWNHQALLSNAGELFMPKSHEHYEQLPLLVGPANQQVLMLTYFQNINRLLQPLHVRIRELDLNVYATWKLTLENGIVLYIGYKDVLMRVSQFVKVYSKLQSEGKGSIASVDLRYPSGMAVQWADGNS